MSYHNIPSSAVQSRTNAQGQVAPEGYHYMPDGSLMSDAEHVAIYGSGKVIQSFILDTTNIRAGGETRSFTVTGDGVFSLEVRNEDDYYYNFVTNLFQAASARLDNISIRDSYKGSIVFPKVTDADQYDFFLFADKGSTHADYNEVRFDDGSLDINSTTGSNSLLVKKVIYQTLDITLTLSTLSPSGLAGFTGHSPTNKVITTGVGRAFPKIPFSLPISGGSTHSFRIDRTPTSNDVMTFIQRTIGSAPDDIDGENIYPTLTTAFTAGDNADTVDGRVASGVKVVMDTNVATKMKVGDRVTVDGSLPIGAATDGITSDTVDGATSSSNRIVMDTNVADKMSVGDQITTVLYGGVGATEFDKQEVTVTHLDPDGDNPKELQTSVAVSATDGMTLFFTPKLNRTTVTVVALNPDGDNVKEFSMSEAIALRDGMTLQFSNRKNYQWPIDNVDGIAANMVVTGTNIDSGTVVSTYEDVVTEAEGTTYQKTIIKKKLKPVELKGVKPVIAIDSTTKLKTVTQTGSVTFNKQQAFALAGDSDVKFYGYGRSAVNSLTDWDIEFTDLEITLTKPTALSTQVMSGGVTCTIDNADGIMSNVSTVSSININPAAVDPTIVAVVGYSGSTATLQFSVGQNIEDGETLTFDGAGRTVTISGNVEIKNAGEANATLYFDLEKFITATDES